MTRGWAANGERRRLSHVCPRVWVDTTRVPDRLGGRERAGVAGQECGLPVIRRVGFWNCPFAIRKLST